MASANCWRCLSTSRPVATSLLPRALTPFPQTAALFSTSTTLNAKPAPKGGVKKGVPKLRKPGEQTTFKRRKKNVPQKTGKAPMPGERKASRKRVVLSNTNALEVSWLRDFDNAMLEEIIKTESLQLGDGKEKRQSVLGKVVGLKGETVDALRAVEAFKSNQGWGLFRRPSVLLREESVVLSRRIVEAEKGKSVLRLMVDGEKGAGKSLMLVQALATAHLRGWIVMTVPEGIFCIINVTLGGNTNMISNSTRSNECGYTLLTDPIDDANAIFAESVPHKHAYTSSQSQPDHP